MKKILALLMALVMVFGLVACGAEPAPDASTDAPAQSDSSDSSGEKVLRIGGLVNQTGWFAVYDYNNILEMKTLANMYNAKGGIEIGGEKYMIEIVEADGQSDFEGVRAAAQILVDEGVDYVIETNDFWVEGAIDLFENAGVMNIMTMNNMSFTTINKDLKYSFSFNNGSAALYAAAIAVLVKDYPDVKSLVYCQSDDGLIDVNSALIASLCEEYGLEYIDKPVVYDAEATDFSAIALQVISSGADAFFGSGDVSNVGAIMKEIRNNGSDMTIAGVLGTNAGMLRDAAGADVSDNAFTLGSDLSNPANNTEIFNEIFNAFKAEYGEETASTWSGYAVNCMYMLLQLLQSAGTTDVEEVIAHYNTIDQLESLYGPGKISGTETYGVNHIISHPNPSTKLVNGEVVYGGMYECFVP
ncbi:MAG: ABC transporter substrate-binding protein [Oscillospiraceae bacterium]|nr:ABC transporter substrate-binding protein [Oscillospiraceae bacterium]